MKQRVLTLQNNSDHGPALDYFLERKELTRIIAKGFRLVFILPFPDRAEGCVFIFEGDDDEAWDSIQRRFFQFEGLCN